MSWKVGYLKISSGTHGFQFFAKTPEVAPFAFQRFGSVRYSDHVARLRWSFSRGHDSGHSAALLKHRNLAVIGPSEVRFV